MGTKICNQCHQEKPLTAFYKEASSKDGRRANCAKCKDTKTAIWREKNKEYYNKSMRDYQAAHPLQRDDCDLKRKYGKSRQWYDETLKSQNNVCAICAKPNTSSKRRLAVDHHHISGKVRGIICYNCNRALHAFDDLDLFNKIMLYLSKHSEEETK